MDCLQYFVFILIRCTIELFSRPKHKDWKRFITLHVQYSAHDLWMVEKYFLNDVTSLFIQTCPNLYKVRKITFEKRSLNVALMLFCWPRECIYPLGGMLSQQLFWTSLSTIPRFQNNIIYSLSMIFSFLIYKAATISK